MRRAFFVLAWPAWAAAAPVTLNGVDIDGITNQKFEKCSVQIDEKGAVHLSCPGYAVHGKSASPTPAPSDPAAKVSRRYWVVTEQTAPGLTDYDIDLFINSRWIRKLRNNEDQIVLEITKYLNAGANQILLASHKTPGS